MMSTQTRARSQDMSRLILLRTFRDARYCTLMCKHQKNIVDSTATTVAKGAHCVCSLRYSRIADTIPQGMALKKSLAFMSSWKK